MRTLVVAILSILSLSVFSQKTKSAKAATPVKAEVTPAKAETTPTKVAEPAVSRLQELSNAFFKFIEVLHGPDVEKVRPLLADGVQTAINNENLKALAVSIRSDLKMVTLSTAVEIDNGRSGWELVQFKYENGPEPMEVFQIVFDKTNKIAFINSNHPNKKSVVTRPD
jgi:hypothetical protein